MSAVKKSSSNRRSGQGPAKNDGKKGGAGCSTSSKSPSKYTIVRSPEDIALIENVRKMLKQDHPFESYKTDSEVYRLLPTLYTNAVKEGLQQLRKIEELTAKLTELEDLRTSFCRIFEICKK